MSLRRVLTILLLARPVFAADLAVVSVSPVRHTRTALATAPVVVEFDKPLQTSSITGATFRVFGRSSGSASGTFSFSNGDQTVTLMPDEPFTAGEVVTVTLANTITATDTTTLRSAGWSWQFWVKTAAVTPAFQLLDVMSNRTNPGDPTRIYGAFAADLDDDGWIDLTTVNEVSGDLRVFMNQDNGTGLFVEPYLTPVPIGLEASPTETADFDNDGRVDAVASATTGNGEWVVLGNGDGTFATPVELSLPAASAPHGVAVLDVDGDGDPDIVNANASKNDVSVFKNNGTGIFVAPTFLDAGVDAEYGLGAGGMNNDGVLDVVVGGLNSDDVVVLVGNGDGTFTPGTPQDAFGSVWQLAVGDIDGDGNLDVATANSFENTGSILRGNGNGTLDPGETLDGGNFPIASDLGDIDGDGDLDWVISSFGDSLWRVLENDGNGGFTVFDDIPAPQAGSCATIFDFDNDGDVDLALVDELADVVTLMENTGAGVLSPLCPTAPEPTCLDPASGKALLQLVDRSPDDKDRLAWKWRADSGTAVEDFGDPPAIENFALCLYRGAAPVGSAAVGPGAKWRETASGFTYKDKTLVSDGVQLLLLKVAPSGKVILKLKGRGQGVQMPDISNVTEPLTAQLHRSGAPVCWSATFTPPFAKDTGTTLKALSD